MPNQPASNRGWLVRGLVALVLLLLVVIGFALAAAWVLANAFSGVAPEFGAALVAASGTVVAASITVSVGRYYERKQEIEQVRRAQQIEIFEEFVEFMFRILYQDRLGEERVTDDEMLATFVKFTRRLTMWAPDSIINSWAAVRRRFATAQTSGEPPSAVLFDFEALLIEMRKTVGYPNTQLGRGDLLRLFVDDIDEHLAARPNRKGSEA